jgi:hypothetical protein
MPETREQRLIETFVSLTDTLVGDYDVVDLLQTLVERSVELFDAAAGGILLANRRTELEVIATTSEESEFISLLQLQAAEGPCIDSFTTGQLVSADSPSEMQRRWPRFAETAADSGYLSVHSIPLRLRDETLGSMNLFRAGDGPLNTVDAIAARALTDVATISILQQRTTDHALVTQGQLQRALDSRVAIEQAKGYVAQSLDIDMDAAFRRIRAHARGNNLTLAEVAHAVITQELVL